MVATTARPIETQMERPGFQDIEAAAQLLDGFTVRQDFGPVIRQYLRKNTVFWPLLTNKAPAEANVVQEMREGPEPQTGFFSKATLDPVENPPDQPPAADLSDPGQEVKAVGGLIKFNHYTRSLYAQQGRPYGDILSRRTSDLIVSTAKTIERALFVGDASQNPLSFNGIGRQMAPGHAFTASKLNNDSVVKKIRALARLAVSDEDILRNVTHIFTSALGLEMIEEEVDAKLEYMNLDEVRPGLKVPGIITQGDSQGAMTPIITSPYLRDSDNGPEADVIHYWLLDMNLLTWKGVYPEGGRQTFDPQVFEVSQFTGSSTPYLVEKRLCLAYGTLYCGNRGEGIWRLSVEVPSGTVGSI